MNTVNFINFILVIDFIFIIDAIFIVSSIIHLILKLTGLFMPQFVIPLALFFTGSFPVSGGSIEADMP